MHKVNTVTLSTSGIPEELRRLTDPPKQLFVQGPLAQLLHKPCVAIVGSRRVTPYGRAVTTKLAGELAERGVVIISGLAIGADSIAHRAALDARGATIAVLPTGLGAIYPRSHAQLAKQIVDSGSVLVSEYAADTAPMKHQFIARNRLIAGLADAVLIPEAAQRSGSLHTANFALEQGKTVMAVPGNITNELARGTNNLIKAGATPITAVTDVFEALGLVMDSADKGAVAANEHEAAILDLIQAGVSEASELQLRSQQDAALFNQTLTMLEITGKIRPLGAGHWALA